MPACDLYLVYFVTSFAARTGVDCALKIFKDNLKTSRNNNSIGLSAEFSKFLGERNISNYLSSNLHKKRLQFNINTFKGIKTRIHFFLLHILGLD